MPYLCTLWHFIPPNIFSTDNRWLLKKQPSKCYQTDKLWMDPFCFYFQKDWEILKGKKKKKIQVMILKMRSKLCLFQWESGYYKTLLFVCVSVYGKFLHFSNSRRSQVVKFPFCYHCLCSQTWHGHYLTKFVQQSKKTEQAPLPLKLTLYVYFS